MIFDETSLRAVSYVKYSHGFSAFIYAIDDAVNMILSPIEQMPQSASLMCDSSPIGILFETVDGPFKSIEPVKRSIRLCRLYVFINNFQSRGGPDQTT